MRAELSQAWLFVGLFQKKVKNLLLKLLLPIQISSKCFCTVCSQSELNQSKFSIDFTLPRVKTFADVSIYYSLVLTLEWYFRVVKLTISTVNDTKAIYFSMGNGTVFLLYYISSKSKHNSTLPISPSIQKSFYSSILICKIHVHVW